MATPDSAEPTARWEHFPHKADVGIRGIGPSPAAAFEQAALALIAVTADPARIAPHKRIVIRCGAPDLELLLFDWLNAVVREAASRRMLFSRFAVRLTDGPALEAHAWGERIDPARHEPGVGVKGATFAQLEVAGQPDGPWHAQCVVDV